MGRPRGVPTESHWYVGKRPSCDGWPVVGGWWLVGGAGGAAVAPVCAEPGGHAQDPATAGEKGT